ncbi:MAG TPA: DUF305 domain-containing protein [Acidimicrobiales bacterium]|nr:DUF305 domain-containing protein [Acidimicrobiales bacterium]
MNTIDDETSDAPGAGLNDDAAFDDGEGRRATRSGGQWLAMAAAMVFLAGSLGYAAGARRDRVPGAESVDVGFLHDMISHHEQAVRMSNLELINGVVPEVQVFGREIVHLQSYEIGLMERQLALWGRSRVARPDIAMAWMDQAVLVDSMPGLAGRAEMRLMERGSGRDADALFVALMKDHHRGGIHMAEYAAKHSATEFVRDIARRMAAAQTLEIREMEFARRTAGLADQPAGYVPAEIPGTGHPEAGDHAEHH